MTYKEILYKYWGFPDFRGIQSEVIESIGAGKDTLGLMPTGGGKSITFQVPALAKEGVCIVITPLISLMKDQVDNLCHRHIKAAAIYSGLSRDEIISTLENCIFGGIKLLYISPERLSSELFQAKLKHMKVSFITVDEAHCISQWGYDFRPSYLEIMNIRKLLPAVPVLALTATATPEVVKDIQLRLGFAEENVFRMSFERKNLSYVLRTTQEKFNEMLHILQSVDGSAIVYCRSRKRTKEAAEFLVKSGISATWYHAGVETTDKNKRQNAWQANEIRVIVATNAFGMGIDKANVRLVIHLDPPSSIEAYFQEAGRAGRDGKRSYAILLHTLGNDVRNLRKRINENFPTKEDIRTIYEHLAYFYQVGVESGRDSTFEFPIDKFCTYFHHFPIQVNAALQILTRAGYIDYDPDPESKARIHFILSRDELYKLGEQTNEEELVISALLRNYSGLFTGYRYIDESYIADIVGLDRDQIYHILQNLSRKRIINFIPRKNIPIIKYLQDRVDSEELVISKAVYEDRKETFENRIAAMISYLKNDYTCRSRQLLRYFGEDRSSDCGCCDICLSYKGENKPLKKSLRKTILSLLADGKKHHITELKGIDTNASVTNQETLQVALEELIAEEYIYMEGSYVYQNTKS
ncbi:RecQ family ATP-dependent DNA helicase [Prevotella aurantiaca]